MANPIMMVPYRSYNKYSTNTANHTHTINRSDTDIHNDNSSLENQQLKRSAASPAVVATTTTKQNNKFIVSRVSFPFVIYEKI
mmetsp:Transcript_1634/g.1814  ORF Transcript_1634/g.1814 Transcript_1634/m.1814 type:complete len:83 (+) Transcript_1634:204-452(+)